MSDGCESSGILLGACVAEMVDGYRHAHMILHGIHLTAHTGDATGSRVTT